MSSRQRSSAIAQYIPPWLWAPLQLMFSSPAPRSIYAPALNAKLGEIRTVTILASVNRVDEIQCELNRRTLSGVNEDQKMSYLALSYVWGDTRNPKTIRVNGETVSVTQNLFVALAHFRQMTRPIELWVDALCINQHDIPERNAQVQLMGAIYRRASAVLMWLGPEADNSNMAFDLFQTIHATSERSTDEELLSSLERVTNNHSYDRHWKAVESLQQRPYWSRVWIVQEIVLCSHGLVCCGPRHHPWVNFNLLVAIFNKIGKIGKIACTSNCLSALSRLHRERVGMLAAAQKCFDEGGKLPLLDALVLCRHQKATDPRDHVYGALGLTDSPGFEINYDKPLFLVYREVVKYSVTRLQSLDILCECIPIAYAHRMAKLKDLNDQYHSHLEPVMSLDEGGFEHLKNCANCRPILGAIWDDMLPSWIPDWRLSLPRGGKLSGHPTPETLWYRASRNTLPDVRFPPNMQYMVVSGVFFDTLQTVMPLKPETDTSVEIHLQAAWSTWCNNIHPKGIYGDLKSQQEAFLQTVVAGKTPDGGRGACPIPVAKLNEWYGMRFITTEGGPTGVVETGPDSLYSGGLMPRVSSFYMAHKFFTFAATRRGFMGTMLYGAEAGDIVVVLLGARIPFLLRKYEDGDKYFLIGECYIHGIMDGEVMQEVEEQKRHVQQFCLL